MNNMLYYQKAIDKVAEFLPIVSVEAQNDFKLKSEELLAEVKKSMYVKVPVVGSFSAGKSSLLNVFINKPGVLPIDTMPETAIAYEIYYGQYETVELYRDGNMIETKPISEIKDLETKPGDVAKVYCDSETVKELQERGIVMVDMPGIDSGIEKHNMAISQYIKSGTIFVFVVDVEQGSLKSSALAFMQELSKYNMYPAVILSKTDKKPEGEIKEIVDYIEYQMTRQGDTNPYIGKVCAVNNDVEGFKSFLNTIDAEKLLVEKINRIFNLIINSLVDDLKIRVSLKSSDVDNIENKIKEIEKEIANVKMESISCENADSPEKSTQDILDNVLEALKANSTDIATMIFNKESEELIKQKIVSVIRSEIIASFKDESEQFSRALGASVSNKVSEIAKIEINTEIMEGFNDLSNEITGLIITMFPSYYKVFAVVINLILRLILTKSDETIIEEIRLKIESKFSTIVEEIRPTILNITIENQNRIKEKIQNEMILKMEQIKEGLKEKIVDADKSKEVVQKEIAELNVAISSLESIKL